MTYPESILPQSNYVRPFPIESIDHKGFSVTRRIEGKLSDNVDVVGGRARLDPDCLGRIVGMSVNLIGGSFLPEYTPLKQIGKGKETWDGCSDVVLADFDGCYEDTGCDYVFYRLPILHDSVYPNIYKFEKKEAYKAYWQFLEQKVYHQFNAQGVEVPIAVTLFLVHVPTNLNYWHFEMNVKLTENNGLLKNDSSWREMIFTHILQTVLCQDFTESLETTGTIPCELYEG